MIFSLEELSRTLQSCSEVRRFHVALSGGLDSSVLLHAMAGLRDRGAGWDLSAIHVHHGLNQHADDWVSFCQQTCQQLDIPCDIIYVDATPVPGESPEATARQLRYQAIAECVQAGDAVVTAHHQDDQAETLLLQLMRGSGLPGLAAMPSTSDFSRGLLLRPLLPFSRQQIRQYALQNNIDWVEDSSNEETHYDRNYMRHEILPMLLSRWPGAIANLSRTAAHMADAKSLLDELAGQDVQILRSDDRAKIDLNELKKLDPARQRNVLRFWLRDLQLPVPSQAQMQQLLTDIFAARVDSSPCVRWPGVEIRRYRDQLYAMPDMILVDRDINHDWDMTTALSIEGVGVLQARPAQGQGLSASLLGSRQLNVRFRQGGERIQLSGRGHHHELKKLFQDAGIPPWIRDRTPILYQGDSIIAVPGLGESASAQASSDEQGLALEWDREFS